MEKEQIDQMLFNAKAVYVGGWQDCYLTRLAYHPHNWDAVLKIATAWVTMSNDTPIVRIDSYSRPPIKIDRHRQTYS